MLAIGFVENVIDPDVEQPMLREIPGQFDTGCAPTGGTSRIDTRIADVAGAQPVLLRGKAQPGPQSQLAAGIDVQAEPEYIR